MSNPRYPEGKLTRDDEGEIEVNVTAHRGKVLIQFGGPVTWLGMRPIHARAFAEILMKHADEAETQTGGNGERKRHQ